eukprot:8519969-Alexandrium_andersonii.AAC.1
MAARPTACASSWMAPTPTRNWATKRWRHRPPPAHPLAPPPFGPRLPNPKPFPGRPGNAGNAKGTKRGNTNRRPTPCSSPSAPRSPGSTSRPPPWAWSYRAR